MANDSLFSIKADLKEVKKTLTRLEKQQLPFALAHSSTKTAQHLAGSRGNKGVLQDTVERVFDRPKRTTVNAFYTKPAKKKTKPYSEVGIKDTYGRGGKGLPAIKYLQAQVYGRPRNAKRHEIALRRMRILGDNEFTVPGDAMKLDRYGGLSGATYSKILADVNQTSLVGGDDIAHGFGQRTTKRGKKKYFYHPNLRPRGIWMRINRRQAVPALVFVRQPNYRQRFDFHGIVKRTSQAYWPGQFRRSMDLALRTAK